MPEEPAAAWAERGCGGGRARAAGVDGGRARAAAWGGGRRARSRAYARIGEGTVRRTEVNR